MKAINLPAGRVVRLSCGCKAIKAVAPNSAKPKFYVVSPCEAHRQGTILIVEPDAGVTNV